MPIRFAPFTRRLHAVLAAVSLLAVPLGMAAPAMAQGGQHAPAHTAVAPGAMRVADTRRGLNVRSGPGTAYPRIGVLPRGQGGQVMGCEASGQWCALSFAGGASGWVYIPMTRPAVVPARMGPRVDWRTLYRTDVPYIHTGTGRVNLRQGAGEHRNVVGKLHPGQGGYVRGCSADGRWCLLSVPPHGVEGWVYMPLLSAARVF